MDLMEVDGAATTLSSMNIHGLNEVIGCNDISSIINSDDEDKFIKCVTALCEELKVLYKLEESVPEKKENGDSLEFLFELSSFLGELECPHEEITCGSLEERLSTVEKRTILINFLLKELKVARLYACDSLSTPKSERADKQLTPYLSSALITVGVSKPQGDVNPIDILDMLHKATDARLQMCVERPKPLFTGKLDGRQWRIVDKETAQNCRSRTLLLLKRLDVTVNSFLWCERIKSREAEIRNLFTERRNTMSHVVAPDIASLLAASHDLLRVEQASSARLRKNTRSKVHPLALAERPTDRGGRTNEMIRDIAQEQASAQRGRGRGRGGGGGGGGGGSFHSQPTHHGGFQSQPSYHGDFHSQPVESILSTTWRVSGTDDSKRVSQVV
ncbi:hypothetical protein KIN20_016943 [Parelaphostrongylus tenuis]|uniref:Protein FAM98A n=1 Tax=Parelaphostrongylus tenuis TaxID=148309 RepID=A0AAD5MMH7_PARTN|nr:hypothetical protein KIN20_016943 [Parelaphostrongylus tenuis]